MAFILLLSKKEMKILNFIFIIFLFCTFIFSGNIQSLESNAKIYLAPGEQKVIPYKNLSSMAIGNETALKVKFSKKRKNLILIGIKTGLSSLILWENEGEKSTYLIRVVSAPLKSLYLEIKRSVSGIEGVTVGIIGQTVTIEGVVYKTSDKRIVENLAKTNENVRDLTGVHLEMLPLTASLIRQELKKIGHKNIDVSTAGEKIFLSGEVNNENDLKRVISLSNAIFPNITHSLKIAVTMEKMILIDLKIAEIRKNLERSIGIDWQKALDFKSNFSLSSEGGSIYSFNLGEGFNSVINMLEAKGIVRILSNPKLVCRNGKRASFQAGGEIPIRLIGERNSEVIFKNYGLILEFDPKIDDSDNVSLDLKTEISDIDGSAEIEGIPGFLKNSFNTSINVEAGRTLVLAGLIENKASKSVTKLPLLGHIPILGELFKSRSFRNNQSEFAVFITPTLIDSKSKTNEKIIDKTAKTLKRTDHDLKYGITD